ncbi:flagellar basal body-associated protein FliL-like protein [Vibrio sp. qd031]|uniref:flagellar basal body-associated FliL family protein n=1 Tax=Vibrio sp. qd031 TaxID=1603038 RepID=UPI000A0F636B|nr:flagellar basal body-associated FliL family protein [Vibrio sp. qd031]ORT51336.1 flagellar basal body-associated protein FliL-like protein [Vibrio sp. qd031]
MFERHITALLSLLLLVVSSGLAMAEEETTQAHLFSYYTLEPELTTNFHTTGNKLGYIRVQIDIMVAHDSYLPILQLHDPLIRDTVVALLGEQDENTITSLLGREELRRTMLDEINAMLLVETGKTLVSDLLFTKYLYQ